MSKQAFLGSRVGAIAVLGTILSFVPQIGASALTFNFESTLEGAQEVPPRVTPASGQATGTLTGDFGLNNFVFSYTITYADLLAPAVAGHIHNAPFGVNGGIVHFLDESPFNFVGTTAGTIIGEWRFNDSPRPLTETLAKALIDGDTYFNIHTSVFPGGEIRGQIFRTPEPSSLGFLALIGVGLAYQGLRRKN